MRTHFTGRQRLSLYREINPWITLLSLLLGFAGLAQAAPTLSAGTASGQPGSTINFPISFNPTTDSVASLQFSLTMPSGVSTGTITPGSIATNAGKTISENLVGNTWTIIVFGVNQNTIGSGTLLTAQLRLSNSATPGTLTVPITGAIYSDPNGTGIAAGSNTSGTITVLPATPAITSAATATGTVGVAFSYQITASNSPTSYNATGLPAGLSVNTTSGLISGTPTTAGTSSVTLSATNTGGTGTRTLTLTVNPPAPVITSTGSATGIVGTAFTYQIVATNSPTSFNATGLPAGLSINTTNGLISGTPTTAGTSTVTLSATNAGGTGTRTLTLTVNVAAPVITSAATATGTVGIAFSYQIVASNTPTSYSATGLPAGLTLNTTSGLISGTPTTAATSNVTLSATNAGGTGTRMLTLTINPPAPVITSTGSATGTVGAVFSYQIVATNNPTSYSAPGLPAGLTLNTTTGLISGTPTTAATSNVTLSATNAGGTGTRSLTLVINPPAPVITSATSASGRTGRSFTYQIVATNNPTSYNASGLPAGLSVNSTSGLISGTPTVAGNMTVALSASNAGGTGTRQLALTIISACDLNSDGASDISDVQLMVNQAINATPCTGDINQDSACNVVDVQRIVVAVLGGVCQTNP
jgi:PKD repeat protein